MPFKRTNLIYFFIFNEKSNYSYVRRTLERISWPHVSPELLKRHKRRFFATRSESTTAFSIWREMRRKYYEKILDNRSNTETSSVKLGMGTAAHSFKRSRPFSTTDHAASFRSLRITTSCLVWMAPLLIPFPELAAWIYTQMELNAATLSINSFSKHLQHFHSEASTLGKGPSPSFRASNFDWFYCRLTY